MQSPYVPETPGQSPVLPDEKPVMPGPEIPAENPVTEPPQERPSHPDQPEDDSVPPPPETPEALLSAFPDRWRTSYAR